MTAAISSDNRAEPNLTPILDMVFQLITFFMLVINFKAASVDLSLKLPVVGSARPVDTNGQEDLLVLNINAEGDLLLYGQVRPLENYIAQEAEISRMKLATHGSAESSRELPTTVVIRADRGVSFQEFNRVLTECQKRGFHKFSLKAFNRAEGPST